MHSSEVVTVVGSTGAGAEVVVGSTGAGAEVVVGATGVSVSSQGIVRVVVTSSGPHAVQVATVVVKPGGTSVLSWWQASVHVLVRVYVTVSIPVSQMVSYTVVYTVVKYECSSGVGAEVMVTTGAEVVVLSSGQSVTVVVTVSSMGPVGKLEAELLLGVHVTGRGVVEVVTAGRVTETVQVSSARLPPNQARGL